MGNVGTQFVFCLLVRACFTCFGGFEYFFKYSPEVPLREQKNLVVLKVILFWALLKGVSGVDDVFFFLHFDHF